MSFKLQAYRNLTQRLGYYDSITELNELAIREVIKNAEEYGSPQDYIENLSKKHGIYVNLPRFTEKLGNTMAQSYIITVYQSAELFLQEYKDEHREQISGKHWSYSDQLGSKLSQAIIHTNEEFDYENNLSYKLFEYYRFIRNNITHPSGSKKNLDTLHKEIMTYEDEIKEKFGGTVPNKIEDICFDDFILFTKVLKEIGSLLCSLAEPSPEELIQLVGKPFRKIRNDKKKLEKSISNHLRTKFSLTPEEITVILNQVDILKII
ncbi:hypothetical protein POL82_27865 [Priestia aryabhattai]|uniref:hypothetical protein n=1 Tax=Priestia aryabhattai TaxID=412384 RepID=UPI00234EBB02|nr:hypothetical protein [Priestia aryabhattai]MDC7767282.1 hypothetical protein [Priestia aryabhattai]